MKIGASRARSRHTLTIGAARRPASSRRLKDGLSISVLLIYVCRVYLYSIVYADNASNVETGVKFQFFSSSRQSRNAGAGKFCMVASVRIFPRLISLSSTRGRVNEKQEHISTCASRTREARRARRAKKAKRE